MARLKKRMRAEGLGDVFWTLHRLKAKGVSDADNDKIAGHRTEAMRNRYNVKIERFKPAQ